MTFRPAALLAFGIAGAALGSACGIDAVGTGPPVVDGSSGGG
jgi:hypothetical protein